MRYLLFCLVTAALLPGIVTVCNADLVTVTFEGPLEVVNPPLESRFSLGDLMQVSITYESSEPDSYVGPNPDNTGLYNCIQSFNFFVDSAVDYTASATGGQWTVKNDLIVGSPYDHVSTGVLAHLEPITSEGTLTGPDVAGYPLFIFQLSFFDTSATALSSDALPLSFNPTAFDNRQIRLGWRFRDESTSHIVPVPGAALLGSLGLISASWRLRKRRTV